MLLNFNIHESLWIISWWQWENVWTHWWFLRSFRSEHTQCKSHVKFISAEQMKHIFCVYKRAVCLTPCLLFLFLNIPVQNTLRINVFHPLGLAHCMCCIMTFKIHYIPVVFFSAPRNTNFTQINTVEFSKPKNQKVWIHFIWT